MAIVDRPPRQIRVQESDGPPEMEVAAVIDVDELQEARKDPEWVAFHADARAYREHLRQEGRSS